MNIPDINVNITRIEIITSTGFKLLITNKYAYWISCEDIEYNLPEKLQLIFTGETKVEDAIAAFNKIFPKINKKEELI